MIKKSPSRNQRSKGPRVKHVLQICLLLAICFWLIYQVKHSRDKRKEFDAEVSMKAESVDGILKLGRKDLPRIEDIHKSEKQVEEEETLAEEEQDEEASKHEEEEQEEANEQEEVNKHDEEEHEEEENNAEDEDQEEVNKNEEMEAEGRRGGDDEVDENEQEKAAGQADRAEDFVDKEKEREEENEEKEVQEENENSSNDQNQEGGGRNTHEAREEHYKADDASSAVSHDVQIIGTENEKLPTENSNENSTINIMGVENEANKTEETAVDENNLQLKSEEEIPTEGGSSLNNTITEEKDHEISSYKL